MGTLNLDRYHAAMGDASYKDVTRVHGKPLSDMTATFYVTQRKLPFAPVLGHERLIRLLVDSQIDRPRLRFSSRIAAACKDSPKQSKTFSLPGPSGLFARARSCFPSTGRRHHRKIRTDPGPGNQVRACFRSADDDGQRGDAISHGGRRSLALGFSLRRNGDIERAVDIATYAFIGGFNDTSNMEAAHRLDIPAVGTEAHYWQQAYLEYLSEPEIEPRTGQPKHFEQVAFERWLDANPNGTTLLLDTIDVYMGAVHAAMAATSTEARRSAFKGFRVDSGDLAELGKWCFDFFEANGLHGLRANLTGDLDVEKVNADRSRRFPRWLVSASGPSSPAKSNTSPA